MKLTLKSSIALNKGVGREGGSTYAGFPTGVENMGGALQNLMRGLIQSMGGAQGELYMMSKNTCEGVNLIVKLLTISLQACKFTENELLHTYISIILARF